MMTADIAFFERSLSTPKHPFKPICFRHAVTLEVPQKISTIRQSAKLAPLAARSTTRCNRQGLLLLPFSWSNALCGAWHPFFMHK